MDRVTDYLRLHCGSISRRIVREDELDNESFVSLQREKTLRRLQKYDLPDWTSLKEVLIDSSDSKGVSVKEVQDRLRDLSGISCDLLGPLSLSSDLVDTTCSFLIQMIHESYYVHRILGITNDHKDHLAAIFDANRVNSNLINRAYDHCKFFLSLIQDQEDLMAFYFVSQQKVNDPRVEPQEAIMMDLPFGHNLNIRTDVFVSKPSEVPEVVWDSAAEATGGHDKSNDISLSLEYKKNGIQEDLEDDSGDESSQEEYIIYDVTWLYDCLSEVSASMEDLGLSLEDVMEIIRTNVTNQSKSREDLQQDLLSLFGETQITLIDDIVSHRGELIQSFDDLYGSNSGFGVSDNPSDNDWVPINIQDFLKKRQNTKGQSIVVQTEYEKKMYKMARKAHKKAMKDLKAHKEKGGKKLTQADIDRMRNQRLKDLMQAMSSPLFKERETPQQPVYEYVFDSFQEAKQTASFIAGNKLILPVGSKQVSDKKYDEMMIPAPKKPPTEVLSKFKIVSIQELDEVAQVGFAGVEALNQIQSIVYKTAYETNENMLVCAPTGAGKTNIAMLTILREIRNNITDDSTLRLNDFKIIYIAPMKALVAEMVNNFSKKLKAFGVTVRELTGDMQMTKTEISKTQMIITTPEKWDVITRKGSGIMLLQQVKLTIIDEVHLLESDRGPVLEALVARIIRNVESCQQMSRLIGLSATLPNYIDVAEFLSVSPNRGMFMFDNRFRPVPLELSFIGVKAMQQAQQKIDMDDVCYDKVRSLIIEGHQVMIFVHARKQTYDTAVNIIAESGRRQEMKIFQVEDARGDVSKAVKSSRNKLLHELIPEGFAIHHAGLVRSDRDLVEKLFKGGIIKVLCCTATLAWGVNLPAHAVIIKGTEVYDPGHGSFVDLSMLDVMQIFGRAGRPQYDSSGFACIITTHDKLSHYLSMLTCQFPIESNFLKFVTDNLNAEIVAGTVSNVSEGCVWLGYTYLLVRMRKNPLNYGMSYEDLNRDPYLESKKRQLIIGSARELHEAKMIVFDEENETFSATDLGRTASHYYIKYDTIVTFNEKIQEDMMEDRLLQMLCSAQEFDQLKSREDECDELLFLQRNWCRLQVQEPVEEKQGKVNVLLQASMSRARLESPSLISDCNYITQNIVRLVRGVFEYSRKSKWAIMTHKTLLLSKMLDKKMWNFQSPFHQFTKRELDEETLQRLDGNTRLTPERIKSSEFNEEEVGRLVRNHAKGKVLKELATYFPSIKPVMRATVLNEYDTLYQLLLELEFTPDFVWNDHYHGKLQCFWVWLFDPDSCLILHTEYVMVTKTQVKEKTPIQLQFRLPVSNSVERLMLHVDSDYWLGCDKDYPVSLGPDSDAAAGEPEESPLTAFKEQYDMRDFSNVKVDQRVRHRETKEDRAHLYPKAGNTTLTDRGSGSSRNFSGHHYTSSGGRSGGRGGGRGGGGGRGRR